MGPLGSATVRDFAPRFAAAICAISEGASSATAASAFNFRATPSKRRSVLVAAGEAPPRAATILLASNDASCHVIRSAPCCAARPLADNCAARALTLVSATACASESLSLASLAAFSVTASAPRRAATPSKPPCTLSITRSRPSLACDSDSVWPAIVSLPRSMPSAPLCALKPSKIVCGWSMTRSKRASAISMVICPAAICPLETVSDSEPLLRRILASDSFGCASSTRIPAIANSTEGAVSRASVATSMTSACAGSA